MHLLKLKKRFLLLIRNLGLGYLEAPEFSCEACRLRFVTDTKRNARRQASAPEQEAGLRPQRKCLSRRKKDPQRTRPTGDCHEQLKQVG